MTIELEEAAEEWATDVRSLASDLERVIMQNFAVQGRFDQLGKQLRKLLEAGAHPDAGAIAAYRQTFADAMETGRTLLLRAQSDSSLDLTDYLPGGS